MAKPQRLPAPDSLLTEEPAELTRRELNPLLVPGYLARRRDRSSAPSRRPAPALLDPGSDDCTRVVRMDFGPAAPTPVRPVPPPPPPTAMARPAPPAPPRSVPRAPLALVPAAPAPAPVRAAAPVRPVREVTVATPIPMAEIVPVAAVIPAVEPRPLPPVASSSVDRGASLLARVRPWASKPASLVAIALLMALLASMLVTTQTTINGDGELLPAHRGWVRHPSGGVIARVLVREGDRVKAGQPLVLLSSVENDRERHRVGELVREARAALSRSQRGPRREEIRVVQARLNRAHTQLAYLRRHARRTRRLVREGVLSRDGGETAQREAALAGSEAHIARRELDQLRAGASREEIEGRQAALARLEAELHYLDGQRERLRLVSPIDGVVATPRLDELTLRAVPAGTEILQVIDDRSYLAEVAVREKALEHIRKGDPISLRLRSNPAEPLTGKVMEVLPRLSETPDGRKVVVRCQLATRPSQAIVGMTGAAVIRGERRAVLASTVNRISRWVRVDLL